jgi:hypothetical protein
LRFPEGPPELPAAILDGEVERDHEFWFGRGRAWVAANSAGPAVHFSLLVDVPRVVARTKRRDMEQRFGVGFCDAYAFTASGLMALFLTALGLTKRLGSVHTRVAIELVSYLLTPYAEEIARRLFAPLGLTAEVTGRKPVATGARDIRRVLAELPAILLTLDRRTRLFLAADELAELSRGAADWIRSHPAARAIELALQGRPTPLRLLLPTSAVPMTERDVPEAGSDLLTCAVSTSLLSAVRIAPPQREFALRAFSRMNVNRNWLIYLPAAVASVQSTSASGELERPEEALSYFRHERIEKAIVEEKHMGSRGIVVLCRSQRAARERFGVDSEIPGRAFTRNGRDFFDDEDTLAVFLDRLERVLTRANFWNRFSTDWVCLDGEILPWAVKQSDHSEESDLVEAGTVLTQT